MLTIFSIPKPFIGDDAERQRKALESWTGLRPECEVILFGDEPGIEETAAEYGAVWVGEVNRSEYGTPLLDDVFKKASQKTGHSLLCYVNADIILHNDLLEAAGNISFDRFLASARRYTVDLSDAGEVKKLNGYPGLKEYVRSEVTPDYYYSMDLFLFHKKTGFEMPPFAVGRPGWDQWFIFRARQMRLPVIDMTEVATIVHQKHGYQHVPGATGHAWRGPEADENFRLIGDSRRKFNLLHSTHVVTGKGLKKAQGRKSIKRWRNEKMVLYPRWEKTIGFFTLILLFLRGIVKGKFKNFYC